MPPPHHNIGRLTAEVLVPGGDAFAAQTKASAFIKQSVIPLIEKVFDRVGATNKIIRLSSLELDLGAIDPLQDNSLALQNFERGLEEKLRNLIARQYGPDNEEAEELSEALNNEKLFLFLLSKGYLPWWADAKFSLTLLTLAQKVLQNPSPGLAAGLENIFATLFARQRAAQQLPLWLLEKILQLLGRPLSETWLNQLLDKAEGNEKEKLLRALYQALLHPQQKKSGTFGLIQRLLKENPALPPAVKIKLAESQNQSSNKLKTEKPNDDEEENPQPETDEDSYFVTNAGLVLLAPLLPHYFKTLELTGEKNQFVSPEAAERALCLMQHIATGQTENFEEHDLVFNKIMCGLPILMPLKTEIIISEKEKEESDKLLQVVVERWTALKNTSPASMRDAFIKRDGILKHQVNGWTLKIERQTIDILIDRLPWGISVIKLPWSDEIIFVDWT